jgi:Flp pilus assembly protein TadB
MKKAWSDLKSFITVAMIMLLFVIVIANILGFSLAENILILVTNLITAVFTYYFTKKENKEEE